jgi:hypothetical protein
VFWDQTQVPRYRDLDDTLTVALQAEYPDIVRFEHDLGEVRALQEDEDKKHARVRDDFKAGLVIWTRAVEDLGYDPNEEGVVVLQSTTVPTWTSEMTQKPEPVEQAPVQEPLPEPGQEGAPSPNGRTNGVAAH